MVLDRIMRHSRQLLNEVLAALPEQVNSDRSGPEEDEKQQSSAFDLPTPSQESKTVESRRDWNADDRQVISYQMQICGFHRSSPIVDYTATVNCVYSAAGPFEKRHTLLMFELAHDRIGSDLQKTVHVFDSINAAGTVISLIWRYPMFNPWHNVEIGERPPDLVNGLIEISKGSRAKYELDKKTGLLRLDRVLYSSVHYPANYGFIPRTLGKDHDPLDILVLSQVAVQPLCIVRAQVIGVMRMVDSGEGDDKIIAVAADDVSVNHVDAIERLPEYFHSELRHFFEEYKRLERKTVLVDEFQGIEVAHEIIATAVADYEAQFGSSGRG